MNPPLVVAHAGEEVLYVLIPVAVILWLRNVAAQRAEREREEKSAAATPEDGSENPG